MKIIKIEYTTEIQIAQSIVYLGKSWDNFIPGKWYLRLDLTVFVLCPKSKWTTQSYLSKYHKSLII